MAIELIEGFGWTSTDADVLLKWASGTADLGYTTDARYSGGSYAKNVSLSKGVTASATFIIGMAIRYSDDASKNFLDIREGTTVHGRIAINATTRTISVYRYTTLLATSTVGLGASTWHYLEIKLVVADSGGAFQVWLDGTEIVSYTGDTKNGGTGIINNFSLYGEVSLWLSDIYVKTGTGETRLGDVKVCTILPNGAGATTQWTPSAGSNYQNVDDTSQDGDSTYNSANTAGYVDTYAYPDIGVSAGTVYAVQAMPILRKDDALDRTMKHVTRVGSTDYLSSAKSVGSSYLGYIEVRETNPATSSAWAISEVNSAEWGVEMES